MEFNGLYITTLVNFGDGVSTEVLQEMEMLLCTF